jgi:energy-coupling factor transport system ATP-binding protein
VARFADRVILLRQGHVVLDGTPEQVFSQVERLDEWGIDVPQLARLGHQLGQQTGRLTYVSDLGSAARALAEAGFAEAAPVLDGVSRDAPPVACEAAIQVRALGHHYAGAQVPALSAVDLDIRRGEWLAIVGVNGSGKSTLLRHLNGLLRPTQGQVTVEGEDTRTVRVGELARVVSYLPQNPGLLLFSATVRQEVGYGPRQLGLRGAALRQRVEETLDLLGLSSFAKHPPAVLSYGLRRQVALVSVLAMEAPILALDEPAVGLDRGAAERLLNVIAGRHHRGTTVVMITHDLRWVARYAQRVAVLHQGHLVGCGPCREVLADLELLTSAGLDPLPVTALAHEVGITLPLPLSVEELLSRVARV